MTQIRLTPLNTKHMFPGMISGLDGDILFKGVSDLPTWMKRIHILADMAVKSGSFPKRADFLGDAFEHFVECIVVHYRNDTFLNCISISPSSRKQFGVDFVGETHDGAIHTHQCKFRSNTNDLLGNKDDISNFPIGSMSDYNASHMTVWTTAKGVHEIFVEKYLNLPGSKSFNVIGFRKMRSFVDENRDFWVRYSSNIENAKSQKEEIFGEIDVNFEPYKHQRKAYDRFIKYYKNAPEEQPHNQSKLKGRFVYPTGSGKTDIQCLILNDRLRHGKTGIHIVVAPRIVLVNQLMDHYRRMIGPQKYAALAFHSGKREPTYEKVSWYEYSTTLEKDVDRSLEDAKKKGMNLVVFSTYHSLHKLVDKFVFDTMVADESQHCVAREFFDAIQNTRAHVKLFFTATERHGMGVRSNDNREVFGDIIGQEAPSVLIKRKILVPPVLHGVRGWKADKGKDSFIDEVVHIAVGQRECTHPNMKSKILFACESTEHVRLIVNEVGIVMQKVPDHDVFTIISDPNYRATINGVSVSRDEFMGKLRESDRNALIFHYDILTEGIDIGGITGCAIMREMNHTKIVQTIGRCLRHYKDDTGKILMDEEGNMVKNRALVSVPVIDNDEKKRRLLRQIIHMLIEGGHDVNYDIRPIADKMEKSDDLADQDAKRMEVDGASPPNNSQDELDFGQTTIFNVVHEVEEDIHRQHLEALRGLPENNLLSSLRKLIKSLLAHEKAHSDSFDELYLDSDITYRREYEKAIAILGILTRKSRGHNIVTPVDAAETLVNQAIGKRNIKKWLDKKIAIMFNVEFVHVLLRRHGMKPKNVTYFGDCPTKMAAMALYGCNCLEIEKMTDQRDAGKKFDLVIGNPPYKGLNHLHQKFFNDAVEMAFDGGKVAFVQPATAYFNKKRKTDYPSQLMRENIKKYKTDVKMINPAVFTGAAGFNDIAMTILEKTPTPPQFTQSSM